MNKTILSFFILLQSLITNAEDTGVFQPPTNEELIITNFELLEHASSSISIPMRPDCNESAESPKVEKPKEEVYCLCELESLQSPMDHKKKRYPLLGEIESSEIRLENGNDNFMHGLLQLNPELKKYDGDDRGRTFSMGASYKLSGTDGEFSLSANSIGFGKFNPQNGYRKDPDSKYYLNFREVNMLESQLSSYYDKRDDETSSSKSYFLGNLRFEHSTDNGYLAKDIQSGWHDMSNAAGKKTILYHYVQDNEDTNTLRLLGGVGREWIKDIGNWKCATRAEIKAGFSYTASKTTKLTTPEIAGYSSVEFTNKKVPWVALSAWLAASEGYQGKTREGGLEISFPIKRKNYVIKPFIGVERHKSDRDKNFGSVSGNAYENYHTFGVIIKY